MSNIDPNAWPELERLLDTALDLPPDARLAWLEAFEDTSTPLKPALRELLVHAARIETSDFMAALPDVVVSDPAGYTPDDIVGPYRLLREIGSGGMASVWLAERTDGLVQRAVALKLPHGAWHPADLAERMVREREILAALEHPNIARLYDAGVTSEGRPFLALEYVPGERIDVYCRSHELPLIGRLELFKQVARAVAYAHGKLAIHRDLKPANVLVSSDGHAKLLDFGIAKLLHAENAPDSALTQVSGRALTPDYAAPEQIRGEPLTVACDVYSLGVLLFELLTDARPYKLKRGSAAELEDAILHTEPIRPSDAATPPAGKALRGDLDRIVLKALRKQPEDRYPTAYALIEDIDRYLAGRPVAAQPDRAWYRVRKFVMRNAIAVGAGAAVLSAVLLGSGVAAWQARSAVIERNRAEAVNDFIVSIFRDADPHGEAGRALTAVELLRNAGTSIAGRFDDRPDVRIDLLSTVGSSLTNLGDLDAAEAVLRQAVADSTASFGPAAVTTLRQRVLLAEVHNARRDTQTVALEIALLEPAARANVDDDPETLVRLLKLETDLAFMEGRFDEIETPAREAFDLALRTLGPRHALTVTVSSLLAESFVFGRKPTDDLLSETKRGLEFALAAYDGHPDHPQVIYMRDVRARGLAIAGYFREAVAEFDAVIAGADAAFGPGSSASAYAMINAAPYERRLGAIEQALARCTRALEILGQRVNRRSGDFAYTLTTRGATLIAARSPAAALVDLEEAESIYVELFGTENPDTLSARFNRAIALAFLGRTQEAEQLITPAHADSFASMPQWQIPHSQGIVARLGGDPARAIARQREALALVPEGPRAAWEHARIYPEIGLAALDNADAAVARDALARAESLFSELAMEMHPAHAEVLLALARDELGQGRPEAALERLERVDAFWRGYAPDSPAARDAALWLERGRAALALRVASPPTATR